MVARGALAVASLMVALAALMGCSAGGNVDLSTVEGAVRGWATSLEDGSTSGLQELAAPAYAYDGAGLATNGDDAGAGGGAPLAPAWMGGDGQVTTEVLEVIETSATTAIARVRIQYIGTMGMGYGGIGMDDSDADSPSGGGGGSTPPSSGGGGSGNSGDEEEPSFVSPGFGGPQRPRVNAPTGTTTNTSARRMTHTTTNAVRQMWWGSQQFSFTAIMVLGLEKISGAWFIVSQRQETSSTLMGNVAQTPIIDTLSVTPEVAQPGSGVTVQGTVRNATEQYVNVRVGWQYAALQINSGAFSGEIRAPRVAGAYVVEAEAVSSSGGGYAIFTRSVEITLEGEPVPSYELSADVPVDAAVEAALRQYIDGVRDPDWRSWSEPYARALAVVADDYDYDGQQEYSAVWESGIENAESTYLTAAVTQADIAGGACTLILTTHQESSYDYGYGWGWGGGVVDGGGAVPDAPPPVDDVEVQPAQLYAWGDVVAHANVLFEFTQRGSAWLITAIRVVDGWAAPESASHPPMELIVNGGQGTDVVGCSDLPVTGTLTGWQGEGYVSANVSYYSYDSDELTGPDFALNLTAPPAVGRWVVRASAYLYGDDWQGVSVYRSVEIAVTEASDQCDEPWNDDGWSGGDDDGREPMPAPMPM